MAAKKNDHRYHNENVSTEVIVSKSDNEKSGVVDHHSENTDSTKRQDKKDDGRQQTSLSVLFENLKPFDYRNSKRKDITARKDWRFWNTQPVLQLGETSLTSEAINPHQNPEEIRKEPYNLPTEFSWKDVNVSDDNELKELYILLNENYVEDDDNMFRFDYSQPFLRWALCPPGWNSSWHVGVRVTKNNKLVGFISAVPATIKIYDNVISAVEINFLCVHKKLRSKRMAPVLIKEITRRVNLKGIFQAVYTAGVLLPGVVAKCRYWHRSLNVRKLVDVHFSYLSKMLTIQRYEKLHRLPAAVGTKGFRRMEEKDFEQAHTLLSEYLKKFSLAPVFSMEEFIHQFSNRENVVNSFVVENEDGHITDFTSFYHLSSTVMHHPVHKTLKAAYSFYNVAKVTPLINLIRDCLIVAREQGFDVFNALDLMDNRSIFEELKFGIGDGNLHYYLYNWKTMPMEPHNRARHRFSPDNELRRSEKSHRIRRLQQRSEYWDSDDQYVNKSRGFSVDFRLDVSMMDQEYRRIDECTHGVDLEPVPMDIAESSPPPRRRKKITLLEYTNRRRTTARKHQEWNNDRAHIMPLHSYSSGSWENQQHRYNYYDHDCAYMDWSPKRSHFDSRCRQAIRRNYYPSTTTSGSSSYLSSRTSSSSSSLSSSSSSSSSYSSRSHHRKRRRQHRRRRRGAANREKRKRYESSSSSTSSSSSSSSSISSTSDSTKEEEPSAARSSSHSTTSSKSVNDELKKLKLQKEKLLKRLAAIEKEENKKSRSRQPSSDIEEGEVK